MFYNFKYAILKRLMALQSYAIVAHYWHFQKHRIDFLTAHVTSLSIIIKVMNITGSVR